MNCPIVNLDFASIALSSLSENPFKNFRNLTTVHRAWGIIVLLNGALIEHSREVPLFYSLSLSVSILPGSHKLNLQGLSHLSIFLSVTLILTFLAAMVDVGDFKYVAEGFLVPTISLFGLLGNLLTVIVLRDHREVRVASGAESKVHC